ncbi:DNA cytosine methyltransferase [Methylomonas methanica]|uniref:DNA cytosine methyltransferase n=1 Tax=Methylomonas methanica TaxID=421 RepID=UPI000AF8A96A|nr:DNA cytosine methyltransferase [Methylomonas methanica]
MENKNTTQHRIKAVDLFCGVGGLTHGLTKGGIEVVTGVDVDLACRFPFEANNSAKFVEHDVAYLESGTVEQWFGNSELRLLTGCAPCQPFSTYSRSGRNTQYDMQWPLVLSFGRLIRDIQPELIAMENVPQLVDHPVFQDFLDSLQGYAKWWSIVDCSAFGVPQTRKRLVLLASKIGSHNLKLLPTEVDNSTVRKTIGDLPPILAGESHPEDSLHVAPSLSKLNLQRIRASKPGGTWRDWPSHLLADCHKKSSGATYPSVYGRMEWDKAAPTITTQCFGYGNGRFGHPEQDRALSLREAAMLQTFPREYAFIPRGGEIKFNKIGKLIGNAVPVRLGEVIAHRLISHVQSYICN